MYQTWTSWNKFFIFSQYGKITLPFCSTLDLIALPRTIVSGLETGMVEQTGGFNFSIKGKKFQIVKPGAQLSIVTTIDAYVSGGKFFPSPGDWQFELNFPSCGYFLILVFIVYPLSH